MNEVDLVANLHAEAELAHRPLGRGLLQRISALGTLMRVLLPEGQQGRLWTPCAVDPRRLPQGVALPEVELNQGDEGATALGPEVRWSGARQRAPRDVSRQALALAEECARVARGDFGGRRSEGTREPVSADAIFESAKRSDVPSDLVAALEHRAFAYHLGRQLGWGLPRATLVESAEEAAAWCQEVGGSWVAKHPYSAAGRQRVFGRGAPKGEQRRQMVKLLASGKVLLLEPWCHRLADYGLCGVVGEEDPWLVGLHRQLIDPLGAFRGVRVGGEDLPAPVSRELLRIGDALTEGLRAVGFRGAYSVDAMCIDEGGEETLVPMVEINARCSFGLLAHVGARRLREGSPSLTCWELHLGASPPLCSAQGALVEALSPAPPDGVGAWLLGESHEQGIKNA